MAITSGASAGIEVTTAAADEIAGGGLPAQTQANGSDEVVVSDTWANLNNGSITAPTGFVGRLVMIREGAATQEIRLCTADTAGTGTTRILTVSEPWTVQPATSDSFYVAYSSDDMEAFTGMTLNSKTGVYEGGTSREWAIGQGTNFAWAAVFDFQGWEVPDRGATEAGLEVENNGRLDLGYKQGGVPIQGAIVTAIQGTATELAIEFKAGSKGGIYSTLFRSWLTQTSFAARSTADVDAQSFTIKDLTNDLLLLDGVWKVGNIAGAGTAAELVRFAEEGTYEDFIIAATGGLSTEDADTTTETIVAKDFTFIANTSDIVLINNKTWEMINPVWSVASHTDINDTSVTGTAAVTHQQSVDAVVQEADGTKLQNALVNVYENTLADLVQELTTDADGIASGVFNYREMTWTTGTGSTATRSGHAVQAGKWLYRPFVSSQASDAAFNGTVVLAPDPNIVQTTQATAKTAGSSITWNEDTNPSDLFGFDTGSGTLAVGMILTFSGGAVGTITESKTGDSVSGVLHLKDRNATAIGATDTFSRTGGTAGTFSGTCNAAVNPVQSFSIWIDAQTLSYQTTYDYLAAIQNETTLTADGELIWEWCRAAQTQPLYHTGSSFYTERSNGKGIIVVDGGAGSLDYFTDDAGVTWVPPTTVTIQVTVLDDVTGLPIQFAHVHLYLNDYTTVVLSGATNASGVVSASYLYTGDEDIIGWARNVDFVASDYRPEDIAGTITSIGVSRTVRLTPTS